jgi:hypothetical protein
MRVNRNIISNTKHTDAGLKLIIEQNMAMTCRAEADDLA